MKGTGIYQDRGFDGRRGYEQGSRDWRMLPVALCTWVAALASHALFVLLTSQQDNSASTGHNAGETSGSSSSVPVLGMAIGRLMGSLNAETAFSIVVLLLLSAGLIALLAVSRRWLGRNGNFADGSAYRHPVIKFDARQSSEIHRQRQSGNETGIQTPITPVIKLPMSEKKKSKQETLSVKSKISLVLHESRGNRTVWAAVLACSTLAAFIASMGADVMAYRDPAATLVREGESTVEATVKLDSPVTAASSWQADCQANARLRGFINNGIRQASGSRIVLYANKPLCGKLSDGQTVAISGTMQTARYGMRPIWLKMDDDAETRVVERAPPAKRLVDSMQHSFFSVTESLSEQGRVLVPGLTIGLLGQDFMGESTTRREPVNATFATLLEMHFKDSGIMHLMAVSGGHFALIGSLIRSGCARFLLPRQAVTILTVMAYVALASAMYPSDSVMRALLMGVFTSSAMFVGRRPQAISALSWTVIFTLLANPVMSRSYGFALSCASVLGIVLCAGPIAERLSSLLPGFLADGMSVTIAAQLFTLPIQVQMTPTLPLLSVPANLVVAPFVDFSTLTGLAGLVFSSFAPHLAFGCVWLSSCGTSVMQWCADTIGGSQSATMPWAGGVGGALMAVICEAGMILLFKVLSSITKRQDAEGLTDRNDGYLVRLRSKGTIWLKETEQMFEQLWKLD
ncbi:ComEC/Rec2 family competence protein [Bifidobacterium sp. ESL0745]|uniref:ComEC/Rec2 family competence protein n=1 Tax=Bifidobacterium sp. ESL0745 TaxID=2983226 RepID=UPI0023F95C58|nr:ComEC/Rec2 family competence protein [Bifidobacterium sp. ESL0745]MDF7665002.1 ComEC/Rec2 family competence protein [Bifidobacterium sp. ESL0745]